MKKVVVLFLGFMLLVMTLAMLFFASAIYDAANKSYIDSYFFQINRASVERPGEPISMKKLSESELRKMFIKKYITEYFYAIPDITNISNRTQAHSAMDWLSKKSVFNEWVNDEAKVIRDLAGNNMLRTVDIDGDIFKPDDSDYWVVPYVLYTWTTPNDMESTPEVTRGILRIDIIFRPGELRERMDVGQHLENGYNNVQQNYLYDPAAIFRFKVNKLKREK